MLWRSARNFVDDKAALRQCITYAGCGSPRRQAGSAPTAARHRLKGVHVPNVSIALRAEISEINGVGFKCRLAEHRFGVANAKREQNPAALKHQSVKAGQQAPKLFLQFLDQRK